MFELDQFEEFIISNNTNIITEQVEYPFPEHEYARLENAFIQTHDLQDCAVHTECYPTLIFARDDQFVAHYDAELGMGYINRTN